MYKESFTTFGIMNKVGMYTFIIFIPWLICPAVLQCYHRPQVVFPRLRERCGVGPATWGSSAGPPVQDGPRYATELSLRWGCTRYSHSQSTIQHICKVTVVPSVNLCERDMKISLMVNVDVYGYLNETQRKKLVSLSWGYVPSTLAVLRTSFARRQAGK